jgi:hypothetical protein
MKATKRKREQATARQGANDIDSDCYEIDSEEEAVHRTRKQCAVTVFNVGTQAVAWPKEDGGSGSMRMGQMTATDGDMARITSGDHLNDALIDLYLKFTHLHKLTGIAATVDPRSIFMCPALMSAKLLNGEDVTRWTKNTSMTTLRYIFMPLVRDLHWTLAVICHPGIKGGSALRASGLRPTILHFDSYGDFHDREGMRGIIAGWLEACLRAEEEKEQRSRDKATAGRIGTGKEQEATEREKRKEAKRRGQIEQQATRLRNIRIHKADAPQQENLVDCGMCVIMNVERLLSLVPEGLDEVVRRVEKMSDEGRKTNAGRGHGEGWKRWYSQQDMTRRREELNTELRKLGAGDITTNVRADSGTGEVDGSTGMIRVWAGTARYQIGRGIQEQKQDRERAEEY